MNRSAETSPYEHRRLATASFAACGAVSFVTCVAFASACAGEDVAFALLPALSALFAGLAAGFRWVSGARRGRIVGTLASIAVAIAWGGLTLVVSLKIWADACLDLF